MVRAAQSLGVPVAGLIAGLGVGGIAVALAAQNILGDLFASLSIVLDKPFVVGDFLAIGDFLGSVDKVGIKTTRLRSLSGEQLVFSNNDLLGSRIRNFGRMYERRVVFHLGVTYQTAQEHLELIPVIVREAVEEHLASCPACVAAHSAHPAAADPLGAQEARHRGRQHRRVPMLGGLRVDARQDAGVVVAGDELVARQRRQRDRQRRRDADDAQLAQRALHDLAGRGQGKFVDEDDGIVALPFGESSGIDPTDRIACEARAGDDW